MPAVAIKLSEDQAELPELNRVARQVQQLIGRAAAAEGELTRRLAWERMPA